MIINREESKRKGLRTALRVAGLAGVIGLGIGSAQGATPASAEANAVDDSIRNIQTHPVGGCWNPRFWGPPAPVEMSPGALSKLRAVVRRMGEAITRWTS